MVRFSQLHRSSIQKIRVRKKRRFRLANHTSVNNVFIGLIYMLIYYRVSRGRLILDDFNLYSAYIPIYLTYIAPKGLVTESILARGREHSSSTRSKERDQDSICWRKRAL